MLQDKSQSTSNKGSKELSKYDILNQSMSCLMNEKNSLFIGVKST